MADRTFVGFGFGAIQAGLCLYEAHRSGNFSRLVVAEVVPEVVSSVRGGGGCYHVNVATRDGVERHEVAGVEIYDPNVPADRSALQDAVAEAAEIATALPSVAFYGAGGDADVARILSAGLRRKAAEARLPDAVVYTAENNNHAAEALAEAVDSCLAASLPASRVQFLNTVIGKMSGVVTDAAQIAEQGLAVFVEGSGRAFLVEEFNRILVSRVELAGFCRGIDVFEEKDDLLPFEEAKLYGHNATHALIGYLLYVAGRERMADAREDPELMQFARRAFLEESGEALCRKYAGVDRLFTTQGYTEYADDLLERMLNPNLRDTVERITRDPQRKLGWDDRLVGTMRVVLSQGLVPARYARGTAAATRMLAAQGGRPGLELLAEIWGDAGRGSTTRADIEALITKAGENL